MAEEKSWITPQDRWQKKAGYKVKGFKLKEELIKEFELACKKTNVGQAAQISKLMQSFIDSVNKEN